MHKHNSPYQTWPIQQRPGVTPAWSEVPQAPIPGCHCQGVRGLGAHCQTSIPDSNRRAGLKAWPFPGCSIRPGLACARRASPTQPSPHRDTDVVLIDITNSALLARNMGHTHDVHDGSHVGRNVTCEHTCGDRGDCETRYQPFELPRGLHRKPKIKLLNPWTWTGQSLKCIAFRTSPQRAQGTWFAVEKPCNAPMVSLTFSDQPRQGA